MHIGFALGNVESPASVSTPNGEANGVRQRLVEAFYGLDWPKMKLAVSGLTTGTTVSSMAALLQSEHAINGTPPEGDCKPPQAIAALEASASQ